MTTATFVKCRIDGRRAAHAQGWRDGAGQVILGRYTITHAIIGRLDGHAHTISAAKHLPGVGQRIRHCRDIAALTTSARGWRRLDALARLRARAMRAILCIWRN